MTNLWTELISTLSPLINPIKGIPNISAIQYIKNRGQLKLGRLSWKIEVLQKLIDNYNICIEKDEFHFGHLSGYFPNLTSCLKANVTPQVTLLINNSPINNKLYGSGFFISFRNDYFDEFGESAIYKIIEQISVLLNSVLRLRVKRAYAYNKYGSWSDSLQDIFPTSAVTINEHLLVVSEQFQNWERF